jgi:hypothetical protein
MVDFADIPNKVSDSDLLRLIAAVLDKTHEIESHTL